MALFGGKEKVCAICGKKVSLNYWKTKDKDIVCGECHKKVVQLVPQLQTPNLTVADYRSWLARVDEAHGQLDSFHETASVGDYLKIDEDAKQWYIPVKKSKVPVIHSYGDVVSFELLEDGNSIASGGLGRAAVGGALFGGAGAIVGAATGKKKTKGTVTKLQLKVTLNDLSNPVEYIDFITSEFKKDGFIYKTIESSAQKCLSYFEIMARENDAAQAAAPAPAASAADEIKKFKELLDLGAITQEEFDAKKKQLLGL